MFQLSCNAIRGNQTPWLPFILLILSNDVHLNPGPPNDQHNFLNLMTWNINSLVKDNFNRVNLIEANNSLHNYDLIAVNETCINDTVEIPEVLLENYTFINSNSTMNTRRGGVGLFYRNNLPLKVRNDLSFPECIVVELIIKRKSLFFTTLYRSPAFNHNSPEFDLFVENFKNLYNNIHAEKPLAIFFSGDFNAHSISWWPGGNNTPEGKKLDELFTTLGLHQIIHEPTNFEPNKNPSCIDLIATDQPNLVLNCGTCPSLDAYCHHQIVHCKINLRLSPPPPYDRKIWHFNQANVEDIKRSISMFPWGTELNLNRDPNHQVKLFTKTVLNIMSNFIPNEI